MQPSMEFANNFRGMKDFLRQCPSVSMAVSVGQAIDQASVEKSIDQEAPLTHEALEDLRQALYDRTENDRDAGQADVLMMLADAMSGKASASSGNPFEDRLRFVEILQDQVKENGRVNFSRAFAEAVGR